MKTYVTSSLLFLLIIFEFVQNSRASNHELKDELNFIHREISLLRDENRHQNKEIDMLKEMMQSQNHKTIPEPITEKSFYNEKMDAEEETLSQHKRPARLLPFRLLYGDHRNDTDEPIRRFYGPPTNCSELSQLGYTLNGFYLVKTHESINNSNIVKADDKIKVEIISCTFKHPGGFYQASNIIQSKASVNLNFADSSKSLNVAADGGIYFRVRMRSKLESKINTDVLFNQVLLNNGGGFYNTTTGQFTIPKTGIYHITFNGLIRSPSASQSYPTFIHLYVNNGQSAEFTRVMESQRSNQVLLATRKLERRDKISIFIHIGYGDRFELESHATFSGFLLESYN